MDKLPLAAIAEVLDKVHASMVEHVEEATCLVHEAETTGRLVLNGRVVLDRIDELVARTDDLRRSIDAQRAPLDELRAHMSVLRTSLGLRRAPVGELRRQLNDPGSL